MQEAPCVLTPRQWKHSPGALPLPPPQHRGVTYYTGKVTVESKVKANIANSDYYHMSSFSSWGVPGDLSMNPRKSLPPAATSTLSTAPFPKLTSTR